MSDLHLQNFVGDKAVHRERHPGRGAPMTQADRPHRDADAVAVMALERVPADIRAQGGVSRMSDPDMIDSIVEAGSGIFKSGNPAERAESSSNRCPDARELRALGRRLDARRGTFAFAHARLAWLESYGEQEAP